MINIINLKINTSHPSYSPFHLTKQLKVVFSKRDNGEEKKKDGREKLKENKKFRWFHSKEKWKKIGSSWPTKKTFPGPYHAKRRNKKQ